MSYGLRIILLFFSLCWFLVVSLLLKKDKIPVKYSIIWYATSLILLLVGMFPSLIESFANLFGFQTISNMVIGLILSLLLVITIVLTVIVSKQNKKITLLIQEVSLLKGKANK